MTDETPPSPARPVRAGPSLPVRLPAWAPKAIFECVLIVFSVVLALGLSNWAEDRRMAARVDDARGYFIEELRANRAMLANPSFLAHHERLRDLFGQAAGGEGPVTADRAMPAFRALFETGIHVAPLRDAVWRSAGSSDLLSEMPLTDVFLLSDIYAEQERLARMSETFVGSTPGLLGGLEDGTGVRAAVTSVQLHLGDVVAIEAHLIAQYDRALAQLGDDAERRDQTAK